MCVLDTLGSRNQESWAKALALQLTCCVILGTILTSLGLSFPIWAKTDVSQVCYNTIS